MLDNTSSILNHTTGELLTESEPFLTHHSKIFLITLYTATTFLSIVGNVLVIVVFSLSKRLRNSLGYLIINLAAADLLTAIFCMPFSFTKTILNEWVFPSFLCPVVLYAQLVSVTASVATVTAIGLDRYRAVVDPIRSKTSRTRPRTIIIWIWIVSCLCSSVQIFIGRVNITKRPSSVFSGMAAMDCTEQWPEPVDYWRRGYTIAVFLATYLLPLAMISVTYMVVSSTIWRQTTPGNAHVIRDLNHFRSKKKMIKVLSAVVILFALCWLPLHAFTLVLDFIASDDFLSQITKQKFYVLLYCGVHWLAMANSFVNPIIYSALNDAFRDDLRNLLTCRGTVGGGRLPLTPTRTTVPLRDTVLIRTEAGIVIHCYAPDSGSAE